MLLKLDNTSGRKTLQISHNFMQWLVVNTLFQEKNNYHNQKGLIQGNTKIGPVLEVATSYLHGKNGVEIRIWSLNRDNTHSRVTISHGSNKFVVNVNSNETEIAKDPLEEYASIMITKDFACRSKAKAKPQRREPAGSSSRIVSIGRRNWIDIEAGKYSFSEYEVSKKSIFFVIHNKCIEEMEQFISGE